MFGSAEEMTLRTIAACLNTRPRVETQTHKFTPGFFCSSRMCCCPTDGSGFASGGLALLCVTLSGGVASVLCQIRGPANSPQCRALDSSRGPNDPTLFSPSCCAIHSLQNVSCSRNSASLCLSIEMTLDEALTMPYILQICTQRLIFQCLTLMHFNTIEKTKKQKNLSTFYK